ncbi:TlpA family protein disulfide reductase [Rhodanobacter denitrificans]|uniref:TlpA family protein disulfide reductase n=1 Tax=Rhodanobacter denitrificans TaxID=666685 RepID=A0A368KBH7_9GAMM|nr:TlpA disulfide reductase family protein [Rhodanobacter denitrificans]RCS29234.1 TlpA family protein disulfide reductase [Rhodanobacter denitrificans]
MLSRSNWLILGLAVLAAALGGYLQHRQRAAGTTPPSLLGQLPPPLVLPDLDGKLHRLDDYRGRRVLLNFWASWCAPCLREMPALAEAQAKFGEQGAIVIGIAMDEPVHVRAFLAAHPVDYPILIGEMGPPSSSLKLGNTRQILPYSVLIDADGRILATHAGPLSAAQLARWLAPAEAEH